jgi:dodecin
MSVARVTEIISSSKKGFDHAIQKGVQRASKTLRDVRGAWVKDMKVVCEDGEVVAYRVNLKLTFVLDDGDASDGSDKDEDK